jgi:O-acetyl-ADP-ribose deacetylase (regulator of RNase III)
MSEIKYVIGDATQPIGPGPKYIVHCCNDIGVWGRGFVLAVSKRWPWVRDEYKSWFFDRKDTLFELGSVQFVPVAEDIVVVNLIGQSGIASRENTCPVQYWAIEKGLYMVACEAGRNNASVHMPRIGCGLAGGSWDRIETIINNTLIRSDIDVTVYDLPESNFQ